MSQVVPTTLEASEFQQHLEDATFDEVAKVVKQLGLFGNSTQATMLVAVRQLSQHKGDLGQEGCRNVIDWISFNFGMTYAEAKRIADVASRIDQCPALLDHFATFHMSFDRLVLLSGGIDDEHTDEWWVENERSMSTAQCAAIIRERSEPTSTTQAFERRSLSYRSKGDEAHVHIRGPVDLVGQLMAQVDGIARNASADAETGLFPDISQARFDALAEVVACAQTTEGERPTIYLFAKVAALNPGRYGDLGAVAELDETILTSETFQRIACDAKYVMVRQDGNGHTVGVGTQAHDLPRHLRRQILKRDGGCRFPYCTKTRWVDVHHIVFWSEGGVTNFDNLITLCVAHHHFVHELGWKIKGNPDDGPVKFIKPNGQELRPQPPPFQADIMETYFGEKFVDDDLLRAAMALGPP